VAEITLYVGQTKPDTTITWQDASGEVIPFAGQSATATARLVDDHGVVRAVAPCTVADSAPNVVIRWADATTAPTAGLFRLVLEAEDVVGNLRYFRPQDPPVVHVRPAPTLPV